MKYLIELSLDEAAVYIKKGMVAAGFDNIISIEIKPDRVSVFHDPALLETNLRPKKKSSGVHKNKSEERLLLEKCMVEALKVVTVGEEFDASFLRKKTEEFFKSENHNGYEFKNSTYNNILTLWRTNGWLYHISHRIWKVKRMPE